MIRFATLSITQISGIATAGAAPFYKEPALFSTAPGEGASVNTIARFGPVGMAVERHQPAFTMCAGAPFADHAVLQRQLPVPV